MCGFSQSQNCYASPGIIRKQVCESARGRVAVRESFTDTLMAERMWEVYETVRGNR